MGQIGRYSRLKALAICTVCGKVPATVGKTTCDKCREQMRKYKADTKSLRNDPEMLSDRPKPKYTLEEVSRMAQERGISYGQMVALLERGENNGTKK